MRDPETVNGMSRAAYRDRVIDLVRAAGKPYPYNGEIADAWRDRLTPEQAARRIAGPSDTAPTLLPFMTD